MPKKKNQAKTISLKERRKRIINLFRYLVFDFIYEDTERRILGAKWVGKRAEKRNRKRAQRFVTTALEMGGVLIKLGQYLSARFDLLPEVWIEELSRLQDAVPPVDFSELLPVIEKDFGDKLENLFLEFDRNPLASASLGQVHKARTLEGDLVAVKVLRPGISLIVEADLEALYKVIDFLSRRTDLGKWGDLKAIAREFDVTLRRELDYIEEARSAERIKANLTGLKYVYVPKVYRERSSSRVITTEFIDGYKVTNFEAIDRAGLDRARAARILANCYLNQILIDGFFHADPHPGNIFLMDTPGGVVVAFVDFGMVGTISEAMRNDLRKLVFNIVTRDIDGIIKNLNSLGFLRENVDLSTVRVGISFFLEKIIGLKLGELRALDYRKVFAEISYIVYSQPLYLPGDVSFIIRALETLVGLCTSVSPELDFVAETRPFIEKLAREEFSGVPGASSSLLPGFLNSPLAGQIQSSALQLLTLPRNLTNVLEKLDSGRIQLQVQSQEIKLAVERFEKGSKLVAQTILASSLMISGFLLFSSPAPFWVPLICLALAAALLLRVFLSS